VSAAMILFMVSLLPGVIFMYNPLQSEMWILVWATFLGTFDAVRNYSGSRVAKNASVGFGAL
jgi:hypothetical protein